MSNTDRLRLWLSWGIPLVAIVIIVVGLAQGDTEGRRSSRDCLPPQVPCLSE